MGWRSIARVAAAGATLATGLVLGPAPAHAATPGLVSVSDGWLNVRSGASTSNPVVSRLANGAAVSATCQVSGTAINGSQGSSALWDQLGDGRFIADAYVAWPYGRPSLSWCPVSATPVGAGSSFLDWAGWYARQVRAYYPVPASVTVAQAILESGWGTSALSRANNNYFGMKCFGSPGDIAQGCRWTPTRECASRGCYSALASFKVYASPWQSFADHARLLATASRYQPALALVGQPEAYAAALQRAGYATDPQYAQKLIGLMRGYNLYRYDTWPST